MKILPKTPPQTIVLSRLENFKTACVDGILLVSISMKKGLLFTF